MIGDPALDGIRQEHGHGDFHESVEDPEDQQSDWESEDHAAHERVSEAAAVGDAKKIFEIRRKGADH
jgi:hypothetical protein